MTYNKNGKIAVIKKICAYSICLVILLCSIGCKFFNQPMLDYLEEWTDTAQINKHTFDNSYPQTEGYTNIPSGKDRVITYYVINPQNYTLDSTVTFAHDDSLVVNNKIPSDFATVEQDATDKSIIRLTLNNSVGATGMLPLDGDGTDISPTLTITEPNSGRNFGSYTVPVRVNSAPAGISSPIILCNTKDNTYVICFNMPDMNTTSSIHRDIVSLTVSGFYSNTYTVTAPSDSDTNGLTGVVNSYNDTNYREVNGSFVGNKTSRFVAIETGISLNTVSEPQCTITLTDSFGLTSAVTASTKAPPLPAVTASQESGAVEPGVPVTFNHETVGSTVTLTLSSAEGVSVSGGTLNGNTATGSSGISLTFLKKGSYTVTATAGGISGSQDTTTTFTYTVPYSVAYIATDGSDDTGTGAPDNPYASLSKAAGAVDNDGIVYVHGQVPVSGEYVHSSGNLTLRGYDGVGTLINNSGRVLNITGGTVTLGDSITLSGTNPGNKGGAVYVSGGNFIMEGDSIITGSTAGYGGGVFVDSKGTFSMGGDAKINSNEASAPTGGGGGVFVNGNGGRFVMKENASITDNVVPLEQGRVCYGGGVFVYGTFEVSGSPIIKDNSNDNVYLPNGNTIAIVDPLSETARIGVTTADTPDETGIKVTDTAVANGNIIFTSDEGYYVDNKSDGIWLRDIEVIYQVGNGPETEGTFTEALDILNKESFGGSIKLFRDISYGKTVEITGGSQAGFVPDTGEGGSPLTIDLNGHTISGNGSASVLSVSTGFLEIKDSSANPDGTGGTGNITGGKGSYDGLYYSGGGIDVETNGALRLVSGAIIGNTSNEGGGVHVSGTFVMTGGSVQSNTASSQGAGVYVSGTGKFTMTGGSISNNWASEEASVDPDDRQKMIQGGGVYIEDKGVVKITGSARITGNQTGVDTSTSKSNGGGVYISEEATFKVSGAPTIYGNDNKNSNGSQNNVNIDIVDYNGSNPSKRVLIIIDGELTGGKIGVSGTSDIFTTGCNGKAETYKAFFAAFHANYKIIVQDGELAIELDPKY